MNNASKRYFKYQSKLIKEYYFYISEQNVSIFELIYVIFFFIFRKGFTIRIKGTLKSINWGL